MRNWKLNRKQKVARNLLVALAALTAFWWMLGFPALTTGGLLRRAEQSYLLDGKAELLCQAGDLRDGKILALHEDRLMLISYTRDWIGRHFDGAVLLEPEERQILFYKNERVREGEQDYWYPQLEIWGLPDEEVFSAQLEWTVRTSEGEVHSWQLKGERRGEYRWFFPFRRQTLPGADGAAELMEQILRGDYVRGGLCATLRFYDETGAEVGIYTFDDVAAYKTNAAAEGGDHED